MLPSHSQHHASLSRKPSPLAKQRVRRARICFPAALAGLFVSGCATTSIGTGGSIAEGYAGAEGRAARAQAQRGTISLEHCPAPLATVALVEDANNAILLAKASEEVQIPASPMPLLRLLLQQSGCFQIVDRSAGLRAINTEHALAQEGRLKEGGDFGRGEMAAAYFTLTPHLVFADDDAFHLGWGGALVGAALLGPVGLLAGGLDLDRSEAQVVMFLTDNRSGLQIAAAEGSAKISDWGFNLLGEGSKGDGSMLGWANSNLGKVVAAALVDGVNKIIGVAREHSGPDMAAPSGVGGC